MGVMKALAALILALLCSSCLSRTCVPVRALGESGEGIVSRAALEHAGPILLGNERRADLRLMKVGREYYLEGVRTDFSLSYNFPYASMAGLGLSDKNPEHEPVSGAERVTVWRRVAVRQGRYVGVIKGCGWVEQLPAGAEPVMVAGYGDVLWDADLPEHGPQHTDWHAVYAYPLAAVTAVGVDLPCTVAGNVMLGVAVVCVEFRKWFTSSPRTKLTPAETVEPISP